MSMSKTAIDHYYNTILRQNYIRSPWQLLVLQTESETPCMKSLPNQNFRFGVLATDAGHTILSLSRREFICHVLQI